MYSYNNNLITPSTTTPDFDALFGGMAFGVIILVGFIALILLAIAIIMIIAQCKIFTKAGEKWWKVFIPLYNSWIQTKITGLAWWWFPIFIGVSALSDFKGIAPIAGIGIILISFNYNYNLAKKFGKSNGFAVLCTFLPFIGLPILGFGSAKYDAKANTDKNGIFAVEKDLVK